MGAEGLEPNGWNTVETAFSETSGPTSGPISEIGDSVAPDLRQESLNALQYAWQRLRTLESLSDDPAEARAAERARGFVDRAFRELEG